MSESKDVSHWIDLVKAGDPAAVDRIWRQYYDRLVRAIRAQLRGGDRAVTDEEDVALSVFDSFYDAAQQGRFPDLADRDDLWRLLMRMAARKVIDKRRRDGRRRRGGDVRVHALGQAGEDQQIVEAIGDEPSPEMTLRMREAVEQLFSHLGVGPLREIAVAKLEGYTNAEIARRLGCSERTIERRLHLIREKCQQEMIEVDEYPTEEVADRGAGTNR